MKKKIFVVVCSLVAALTLSAILVPSEANALAYQKASFLVDDSEGGSKGSTVYADVKKGFLCCGTGNVNNCAGSGVDACDED